jgi:hypothetical protein
MNLDRSADIATGLLQEAAARGLSEDELIRKALAAYQRNMTGGSTVRRVGRTNREAEVKWFLHPDPQFVGKWVVRDGSQVVVSGPSAKAVYEQAKARGIESPFVAYISARRNEPFGGWLD